MGGTTELDQVAAGPAQASSTTASPGGAPPLHALQSRAGNRATLAVLQTKLSVGRADDPAEREADQVARDVMRRLAGAADGIAAGGPQVGRLSRGADVLGGQPVSTDVEAGIASSSGRTMDGTTLARMESAFGANLSDVRIHDGAGADTLSRSLQAEAFTTGSDVFFRQGNYAPGTAAGQELLAHELTHVVQQSGGTASRRIRRFVTVKDFAARTDEGMFTTKGPAQEEIEKQLTAYLRLGQPTKRPAGAPPHPSGVTMQLTLAPDKVDQGIAMLKHMRSVARLWLDSKVKTSTDDSGATITKIDPSRAKRGAGMVWFLMAADGEISRLEAMRAKALAAETLVEQSDVLVDDSGMAKLKEKYTGDLGTGLSVAGAVVGKAIANDGDSTEFELNLKIPVSPGVFVGGILRFDGTKAKGATAIGVEAMFQAGGSLGVFNIHGALGGYFKASAKSPEGAMKLISYGFYRRCRESDVIPAQLGNKIWGGTSDDAGGAKADKWAREVEGTELQDDDSFVETGAVGEVGAGADLGPVASLGAAGKLSTGTRHDKASLAAARHEPPGSKTGRAVSDVQLSASASVLGGKLAGDVKLNLSWKDSLDGRGIEFDAMEVQGRVSGRIPAVGMTGAIAGLTGDFAKTVVTLFSKQFQQAQGLAAAKKMAMPSLSLAKDSAEVTLQKMLDISVVDALKGNTLDRLMTPAPKPAPGAPVDPGAPSKESTIGLELAYRYARRGATSVGTLELRHLSAMSAKLPALLKAELVRRSRLLAWENQNGGAWSRLT